MPVIGLQVDEKQGVVRADAAKRGGEGGRHAIVVEPLAVAFVEISGWILRIRCIGLGEGAPHLRRCGGVRQFVETETPAEDAAEFGVFRAGDVVEEFAQVLDAALRIGVDTVHDGMDPDFHAFMAQKGGEYGQMVLVSGNARWRHRADQVDRAAERPHTRDDLLQNRMRGNAAGAIGLEGAVDARERRFHGPARAERRIGCLRVTGFAGGKPHRRSRGVEQRARRGCGQPVVDRRPRQCDRVPLTLRPDAPAIQQGKDNWSNAAHRNPEKYEIWRTCGSNRRGTCSNPET